MKAAEKRILVLLSMAQLILTLDSTVMNVSISTLVKDLNTTVAGIQSAIAFYTLVMAAFMIAGAKVGDIIGRKKAFIIGTIIYGIGSSITAVSQNLPMLMFGWSLLEGLGAALMIPAMVSLVASNFSAGPRRIKAYGTVAAMAAIGAGIGPIVGGLLTTYATWRLAFAGEVIIVIYILLNRAIIKDSPVEGARPKLDLAGVALSVAGMAIVVQGILLAGTYGLFRARQTYTLGRLTLETGGISPTIVFVAIGLGILALFALLEAKRSGKGKDVLVHLVILKNKIVSSGAGSMFAMQFLLAGIMYSLALYLQIELGYNAFITGLTMLPLSFMVLVLASRGSIIAGKYSSRTIVRTGFVLCIVGAFLLGFRVGGLHEGLKLAPSLAFIGAGVGIIVSQLQNLVQSAVSKEESAEASGLMATFQYLGMSVGTALSGVILVGVLIATSTTLINQSTVLSAGQKTQLEQAYNTQAQIASDAQIEAAVASQPADVGAEVVRINAESRQKSLQAVFILLATMSAFGLLSTKNLPEGKPKAAKNPASAVA